MRSSHLRPEEAGQDLVVGQLVADRASREWCLFLDRDGVLNKQIVGDYVRDWRQFEWLPRVTEALRILRQWAPYLVIVTNQQGIGKGLMSVADVDDIHKRLGAELASQGVTIDGFQVCPHLLSDDCACRKPRTGLILDWLATRPQIEPALSIMAGDSPSDLELARNLAAEAGGCGYIHIGNSSTEGVDAAFDSLWDFATSVARVQGERSS